MTAPSFNPLEFPTVTVPASPLKAGLSFASASMFVSGSTLSSGKAEDRGDEERRLQEHIFRHRVHSCHLEETGTRFELECYDVGHLYKIAYFVDRKIIKGPIFIQAVFGILGGLGPDPENIFIMRSTADRLFGRDNHHLSVLGGGRHQMAMVTMGVIMGANVRVSLKDNLFIGPGTKATSNAEQVMKIRRILDELSLEIATPSEVREILQLKGRENVHFA